MKNKRLSTLLKPSTWYKRSLLLAIYSDGTLKFKIYKNSVNKIHFQDFINFLNLESETVLLDNVAFHKIYKDNQNFIYTPPYQPEYNPVEYCFSKIKSKFKSLRFEILDVDECLIKSIQSINQNDIFNTFEHVKKIWKK